VGQRPQNSYLVSFTKKVKMVQTKTIAMVFLIAIATIGAIGIEIGTATQSVQGQNNCLPISHDPDDFGKGQSFHDCNGDLHSNGHAIPHP
jgi:hypothetical protein